MTLITAQTGQLGLTECSERELPAWLARLNPAEVLHDGSGPPAALLATKTARTARPAWQFDTELGERKLREQLQVASLAGFNAQDLKVADLDERALESAAMLDRASLSQWSVAIRTPGPVASSSRSPWWRMSGSR